MQSSLAFLFMLFPLVCTNMHLSEYETMNTPWTINQKKTIHFTQGVLMLVLVLCRSEVTTIKQRQTEPTLGEQLACGFTARVRAPFLRLGSVCVRLNHPAA